MDNKITIQPSGDTLTILTGEALPLSHPQNIRIVGTLSAPGNWFTTKNAYDYSKAHVIVDKDTGKVSLFINEHETYGSVIIVGHLKACKDLEKFRINSQATYTVKGLKDFLKMNRVFFTDRDENLKLVSDLETFKIKINQEIEQSNDLKGQKKALFAQQVQHDLKLSFKLTIPIYEGQAPLTFNVDINFDITDGSATLWLESVELKELQTIHKETIMGDELKRLASITTTFE